MTKQKPRGNSKPPTDFDHQAAAAAARFKPELAATALVEALYVGDRQTAEKFGVTANTIKNWRARLNSDQTLSKMFEAKRAAAEVGWADDVTETLRGYRAYVRGAARDAEYTPEMLTALTMAGTALQEAAFKREILDARIELLRERYRLLGERRIGAPHETQAPR